jgi:hypothetical protein
MTIISPFLKIGVNAKVDGYRFLRTGEKETYDTTPFVSNLDAQITPATPDLLSLYPDVPVGQLFDVFTFDNAVAMENGDKLIDENGNEYIIRGVPAVYDVPPLGIYYVRVIGVKIEILEEVV